MLLAFFVYIAVNILEKICLKYICGRLTGSLLSVRAHFDSCSHKNEQR